MREIKFRQFCDNEESIDYGMHDIDPFTESLVRDGGWHTMQYTGLKDAKGDEICVGYILEFDNKDRFVIKEEEWLELYIEWIGEPLCSDQARDLYRIGKATIIGNIYQNPELLKDI
jgi:hypothetical protein